VKLSRRTNTIILWIVSIGLLAGMVITFTPTLGTLGAGSARDRSPVVLEVNGSPITDLELSQARQSNRVFNAVREGPVGEDLQDLLVDAVVRQRVVQLEASSIRVGNRQVRQAVDDFRERNGVAGSRNDGAYLDLIASAGFTDASFRDYLREQLQIEAFEAEVTEGIAVSEDEVAAFYAANENSYLSEPQVTARQIVVDTPEEAEAALGRINQGEAFADVAADVSLEAADVGGAVGGETPQPVGRPAFPSAVASQVFALREPGVTDPVETPGGVYIVEVEEVIPAEVQPLEAVYVRAEQDALEAKRSAALEDAVDALMAEATVTATGETDVTYDDPVIAVVAERDVRRSDLLNAVYGNPQIQQALSPDTAGLIVDFFKPSIYEQLVDRYLAVEGASDLDVTVFGDAALRAQIALNHVARDAEATSEAVQAYYDTNQDRFTVSASADVIRIDVPSEDVGLSLRDELLAGSPLDEAVAEAGGSLEELGTVRPGRLNEALDTALFETEAFTVLPGRSDAVSDVLVVEETVESDDASGDAEPATETQFVLLVAERTPERVRPLSEVRADVEQTVLAEERQALQQAWLDGLEERIVVERFLTFAGNPLDNVQDSGEALEEATEDAAGDTESP
jgi:parvulin-like peptidyl-prolyl isomerase